MRSHWAHRLLRVRWVVRAPIGLYHARLGRMFGSRLLLLEHVGRTTGRRRRAVLEVVDRPDSHTFAVVSGFGPQTQWLRNVMARPDVRVSVGRLHRARATAQLVPPAAAARRLEAYARRHAFGWRRLEPMLREWVGPLAPGERLTDRLPMVEFRLANGDGPESSTH